MLMYRIVMDPEATEGGSTSTEEGGRFRLAVEAPEPSAERALLEARLQAVESAHAEQLAEQARKSAALERAYKTVVIERELATVLAGRPLVAGAAAQLVKLWRDEFEVIEEGATSRVVAGDGRAAAAVIVERLASAEYAHFSPSSSRGGTAARAAVPVPGGGAGSGGPEPMPRNLGEATIRRWLEDAARSGSNGSAPIGLNRRRR